MSDVNRRPEQNRDEEFSKKLSISDLQDPEVRRKSEKTLEERGLSNPDFTQKLSQDPEVQKAIDEAVEESMRRSGDNG